MKVMTFVITENTEPINALKTMKVFFDRLEEDLYNWKWIIIAAHNCMQNFMVSSLRSSNNLNILEDKSSKDWFDEFAKRMESNIEDWKSPREKLDYFLNLYEKIKSDNMLMLTISKKLVADKNQDEAMKWLNWHRNNFTHFVPSAFVLNVVDFPKRMLLIMDIIKFLVSENGNILWVNTGDKIFSQELINELIENFNRLNQKYTSEKDAT
jgi:hypothetical protein